VNDNSELNQVKDKNIRREDWITRQTENFDDDDYDDECVCLCYKHQHNDNLQMCAI